MSWPAELLPTAALRTGPMTAVGFVDQITALGTRGRPDPPSSGYAWGDRMASRTNLPIAQPATMSTAQLPEMSERPTRRTSSSCDADQLERSLPSGHARHQGQSRAPGLGGSRCLPPGQRLRKADSDGTEGTRTVLSTDSGGGSAASQ